jgi:hypothetical protein
MGIYSMRRPELSHRVRLGGHLVDVAGFYAHIKEMPGHKFVNYFFVSIAQAGQADKEPVLSFPDDVNVFNPARPALYTEAFHRYPPMFYYRRADEGA